MGKCCASIAASLRDRVTIQNASRASDGQGGFTETWADGSSIWANVEPLKGYEKFQAMQTQTPVTHRVTVRYTSEITTASRIKFGSRVFAVKEVINVEERGRFLILKAIERA